MVQNLQFLVLKNTEPNNYGKIIFSEKNDLLEIIEEKDTKLRNIKSDFCNGGIMAIHSSILECLDEIAK